MMLQKHRIFLVASALAGLVGVVASVAQATTITIVNLDGAGEGFNDPRAAAPVGGNPGVTVGAQRLNVFANAAAIWAARISSSVEIKVGAKFDPLSCTSFSGVLGSAGPVSVFRDFTGALLPSTWYPVALANALAGSDLDPSGNDISATFNGSVGTPGCLDTFPWYYGFDGAGPAGSFDLTSVVLHELGHGLGFTTVVNLASGAKLLGFNDTFMLNLEDHSTGLLYPAMTNAERVTASKNTGNLHWVGANVRAASGSLSAGKVGDHVRMYAPNPQQPGSSVSHWDTALTPNQLMEPTFTEAIHNPELESALFQDIGWTSQLCSPSATTLCIDDQPGDGRFQIRVTYQTTQGGGSAGNGQAIPLSSLGVTQGGLMWFFEANNPELLIKILPKCSLNAHYWVFASAGTNVGVTIRVTDLITSAERVYTNPDIHPMTPIQDIAAFPCP